MKNFFAGKVANRIVQLFGRINRGRNDYGVFLIAGKELNVWLNNDRNLTLLPELLQQQIKLGEIVQEGMGIETGDQVCELISAVIARDQTWLQYYGENIQKGGLDNEDSVRATEIEERLTSAALAEAAYAKAMWEGDYVKACRELEVVLEETLRADTPLSGWHNIWLGASYEKSGDVESAGQAYERARTRLGANVFIPKSRPIEQRGEDEPLNKFGYSLNQLVGPTSEDSYRREKSGLENSLFALNGGSPAQVEAATRELGDLLGFTSTRPDNDEGTGPDVIWVDDDNKSVIAFELKTDKGPESSISKKDVGQGHQHCQWVQERYPNYRSFGLYFVSDVTRCELSASPSPDMFIVPLGKILQLKKDVFAIVEDLRSRLPIERFSIIKSFSSDEKWTLSGISEFFEEISLKSLQG